MLETGQPLHAFDAQRLASITRPGLAQVDRMGLRQASSGEPFTGLDGTQHLLSAEALVVTYGDKPIALAGVMGGAESAVHGGTTAIWLEAAVFAPQAVRRSARSVGLRTEASSRFEKGLPPENTLPAADRAVALLTELCGAQVTGRWLHQRPQVPFQPIELRRDALHNLLGPVQQDGSWADLSDGRITSTLSALGCFMEELESGEGWQVSVPQPVRLICNGRWT